MDTSAGLVKSILKQRVWLIIGALVLVTAGAFVYQQQRLAAEKARVQSQIKAQQEAAASESPDPTVTPQPTLTPVAKPDVKGAQTNSKEVTEKINDDSKVIISQESHQLSEGEGASNYNSNTTSVNVNGSSSCSSTVTVNGKTTKKSC